MGFLEKAKGSIGGLIKNPKLIYEENCVTFTLRRLSKPSFEESVCGKILDKDNKMMQLSAPLKDIEKDIYFTDEEDVIYVPNVDSMVTEKIEIQIKEEKKELEVMTFPYEIKKLTFE